MPASPRHPTSARELPRRSCAGPTARAIAWVAIASLGGCLSDDIPTAVKTVDLGDHFEAPDRQLDEDEFHCVIQPDVITQHSCAQGIAGDNGCHTSRSALRLVEVNEVPRCEDGKLLGQPPADSQLNLDRVRVTVSNDPDTSPFYRRPVGLDTHPRIIFDEGSDAAQKIRDWINAGTP